MKTLDARLTALETRDSEYAKVLPDVVPDSTSDAELAQLSANGRKVYRVADFVELCRCFESAVLTIQMKTGRYSQLPWQSYHIYFVGYFDVVVESTFCERG